MNKKNENSIQNILFQQVQESIPVHCSLVEELAELLDISNDSVYRRLRNETMLTIDEVNLICKKFTISFDSITKNDSNSVVCNYALLRNEHDLIQHLLFMYRELDLISKAPDSQLIYAAIDIPIFHHFQFKELAAFKIFYWLRSVINDSDYSNKKFDPHFIQDEIMDKFYQMSEVYKNTNVTEIWTDSTVRSLIKQIDYFWDSGMFESKDDALLVCQQALDEINYIQNLAAVTPTNKSGEHYRLYFSEIEISNNSILAKLGNLKRTYLSYNTINLLATPHTAFCNEIEQWQENILRKSTLISGASEKTRYQFFKRASEDLLLLSKKIENE